MLSSIIRGSLLMIIIAAVLFVSISYRQNKENRPQDAKSFHTRALTLEEQLKFEEACGQHRQAYELVTVGLQKEDIMAVFVIGLSISLLVVAIDWLTPKKSLNVLAGIFFGLLVGVLISWAMSPVLEMINDIWNLRWSEDTLKISRWIISICICYLTISLVIKTKDDVRFVIPYVEFSRQTKGLRPLVIDTSVIIDGRIADIAATRLFDSPLIVPRFVLNELQLIADSSDKLKRTRGRRGLDILNKLQNSTYSDVQIDDTPPPGLDAHAEVDHKLIAFSKNCDGRLLTNDYNLNKVAQLRGVDVININDLANALKAVILPGEQMTIRILRPGEESTQGVGYLDDGTMVVVENARSHIGENVEITVTSAYQTSAGRMIFGRFDRTLSSGRGGSANPNPNANATPDPKRPPQA